MFHYKFQSTLPRGSDYLTEAFNIKGILFQSTLPRGSDPVPITFAALSMGISIHAPSRERPRLSLPALLLGNFNPRSLAGATTWYNAAKTLAFGISIHAPSRERQVLQEADKLSLKFQSTLPRGSDGLFWVVSAAVIYFNPRSLAGATGADYLCCIIYGHFNPRSLAGATSTAG